VNLQTHSPASGKRFFSLSLTFSIFLASRFLSWRVKVLASLASVKKNLSTPLTYITAADSKKKDTKMTVYFYDLVKSFQCNKFQKVQKKKSLKFHT
jgi:hypothetical protein